MVAEPSRPQGVESRVRSPEGERLAEETVRICRDLIRVDSSNFGDDSGPGEREAAELVMAELTAVGFDPLYVESRPRRGNILLRITGSDPSLPGLAVHGHLDTVPAVEADWRVPPWQAEVVDDCIWGRGAVDMKAMNAMIIANLQQLAAQGWRPRRDLVVAFFADEEALSALGSHWIVDQHPDYFAGVGDAVSEVGGFSVTVPTLDAKAQRVYLLQTAEKGTLWLRLRATGRAGHGSVPNPEGAINRLAETIARVSAHDWPVEYLASVRSLLRGLTEITGWEPETDPLHELIALLGPSGAFVDASLRDTVNVTKVLGGYLNNVVPQHADAWLDCRFLPGHEEQLLQAIRDLAGEHVEVHVERRDVALEAPVDNPLIDDMTSSILAHDPTARVLPYCLAAGTDNKALSRLGIRGYGFAPLKLPADLEFAKLFHGIDERVPLDSVAFGAHVMNQFLRRC